jgi:hypothetical protein
MSTIQCPMCNETTTYVFTPVVLKNPFGNPPYISSITLSLSCGDKFPLISVSDLYSLQDNVRLLFDRLSKLEVEFKEIKNS